MEPRYSTKFFLERRKNSAGEIILTDMPIRMYFSFEGKRLEFFTGFRIDEYKWDFENQKVRANCVDSKNRSSSIINSDLLKYRGIIEDLYKREKAISSDPVSVKDLMLKFKESFTGEIKIKQDKKISFDEAFKLYYSVKSSEIKPISLKNLNYIKHRIKEFAGDSLLMEEIDFNFITRFKIWFLKDEKHSHNTFSGFLKRFKSFLNYAKDVNWIKNVDYKKITAQEEYPEPIYLTWREFIKLKSFKPSLNHLAQVRDVFVFQSMVGCRYEDLKELNIHNVINNTLSFVTSKDNKHIEVPLHKFAISIIKKYKGKCGDMLLPVISNQKYNDYLKDLASEAELTRVVSTVINGKKVQLSIDKAISSHMARRNFIGNHINEFRTPEIVIKSMTGHADSSRSFQRYYKIDPKTKADAIKNMK